ncbi:MAG: hypothetical protein AB8H79_05355 [Myxococcota bacterium]
MIGKLPLFGAILAGLAVLLICGFAMVDQMPPVLESGRAVAISVTNGVRPPDLIDANFATAIVVLGSLAGLTMLFFVFLAQPKTGRSFASRRRQASGELISRALDSLRGQ